MGEREGKKVRVAVIGLGKMGLSHLSMIRAHPEVQVVAICDSSKYLLDVLEKYTGIPGYSDWKAMLKKAVPEAIIIATPSRMHADLVRGAMAYGAHVFCEKPFSLDWQVSEELAGLAERKGLVNQVGYHCRFIGSFREVKRLLGQGAIGKVSHVLAEAYGPVVLRAKGNSWRSQKDEGGGCLYDYAAHPVDLLNWYFGVPDGIGGSIMSKIFSRETDDEVYSTFRYSEGHSVQLSVNWSDESFRKMTVRLSIWGSAGRISVDRQECQVYLREAANAPAGYEKGWNVRYTTELTDPVWFYVRGEEYSAQLDHFVSCISSGTTHCDNSFASAAQTDRILSMIRMDASANLRLDTPTARSLSPA